MKIYPCSTDWRGIDATDYAQLKAHGDRVHANASAFP